MDDEKCPCDECYNADHCDYWDAAFCCDLCNWMGGGDCDSCDPMDI